MMQEKECTDIWRKYQAGKDHHNKANMYTLTEKCHRFYEGDQWHGLQSGDEELPVLNFIKPICRYKIAMVAIHLMTRTNPEWFLPRMILTKA